MNSLAQTLARGLAPVVVVAALAPAQDIPTITLTRDDTRIERSCRVRLDGDTVIPDRNGDGVVHVVGDGVVVEFVGAGTLRGAPASNDPDTFAGVGIRIDARRDVTIRGARVAGFKIGLLASGADALRVEDGDYSGNFAQRLRSTALAEDPGDWLWPHDNDRREWATRYGAAVCVERSRGVAITGIRVRRGQNGIILDRVEGSRVERNDCSFLSGWGLAMWRSNANTIADNAFDFCVRGYSHGVYNRGQDSAGILLFEQCSRNTIARNTATHGGDGFFAFAGKESLGERAPEGAAGPRDDLPGCDHNTIDANDFSHAAAHGLELTFSTGNTITRNTLAGNAICGIWAGYSRDTVIAGNRFSGNGAAGYGQERGGINIEHASRNVIARNTFRDEAMGVRLWWDDDAKLLELPGVRSRGSDARGNVVQGNRFEYSIPPKTDPKTGHMWLPVSFELHNAAHATRPGVVADNTYADNAVEMMNPECAVREVELGEGVEVSSTPVALELPGFELPASPDADPPADARSLVARRRALGGREAIVVGEWWPWDHESIMVRERGVVSGARVLEVFGVAKGAALSATTLTAGVRVGALKEHAEGPYVVTIGGEGAGVRAYRARIRAGAFERSIEGTIVSAEWSVTLFPLVGNPTTDAGAFEASRASPNAVALSLSGGLSLPFGTRGPKTIPPWREHVGKLPWREHYGVRATTTLDLPAGRWRVTCRSDDGVRVRLGPAGGEPGSAPVLIENWTHHAPTTDRAVHDQRVGGAVAIEVDYFQLDGHAELSLEIAPEGA